MLLFGVCAGAAVPSTAQSAPQPAPLSIAATNIVISEFRFRGGGGASDEFVEIYNPTSGAIDISGWRLYGSNNAASTSIRATIPSSTTLQPGQYYLIANTSYNDTTPADLTYSSGITDDGGAAITTSGGTIIDQVGLSSGSAYKEGTPLTALLTSTDQSYERKPGGSSGNCLDDGDNSTDFSLLNPSSPQNSSSARVGCIDLSVTQSVDNPTPAFNDTVIFTITVSNAGPGQASGVQVKSLLPSGVGYESDDSGGAYNSSTGIWVVGTLNSGSSAILNITARAISGGTKTNWAEVWAADQADANSTPGNSSTTEGDDDSATITVPPSGINTDIGLTQSVNNAAPFVNDNIVFTITATNNGPNTANYIYISDALPAGLTFVSYTATSGTYSAGQWYIPSLSAGSSATLKITATVNTDGMKTNIATLIGMSESDTNASNDTASVNVTPMGGVADLNLTLEWFRSDGSSPAAAGQVYLRITITNNGPYNATNVVVYDKLPSGLTYVADDSGGAYNKATGFWNAGAIPSGGQKKLKITAKVDPSGTMTNNAEVWSADQSDPDSTPGNSSTTEDDDDSVTVPSADLSVVKSMDNVNPSIGTDVVFTIRVSNGGPDTATNVKVKDVLPSSFSYVSDDSGGAYNSSTGIWNVGSISNGATRTLRVTATMISSSLGINWAEVWEADQIDTDSLPGNSSTAEDDDDSAPEADLRISQAVSNNGYPGLNTNFLITVTVTNDGTVGSTNVQVRDKLPAGISYVSHSTSTGTYSSGTGIWTVGTLNNGASATLIITAKVTTAGIFTNWAEVWKSDLPDPDSIPGNSSTTEDDDDSAVISYRHVLINEVAWAGTSASLPNDQWIELYNPYSVAVNITGWQLRAADSTPAITLSGTIPAGGFFLLERDDNSTVSDVPANQIFTGALSTSGEALTLYNQFGDAVDTANGNGGAWPKGSLAPNYASMERQGTGAETDTSWVTNTGVTKNGKNANGGSIYGTPGQKNSTGVLPTPTPTNIPPALPTPVGRPVINEFLPRPGFDWNQDGRVNVFDEFIEIINLGPVNINLRGWKLDDEANLGSAPYTLPDVELKPGERYIVYGSQSNILLGDGGDTVRLLNPSNKVYDAYTYKLAGVEDRSICRIVDGSGNYYEDCIPTPNRPNSREGSVPVMPQGDFVSPVCNFPDTIPADIFFAECRGYGANIWRAMFWDAAGWNGDLLIPAKDSKWPSFVE